MHTRVPGPLDGHWKGPLDVPIRIYDLSVGGCFVQSLTGAAAGQELRLVIDLSTTTSVLVKGIILESSRDLGFAVKFIDVSDEVMQQLRRAVEYLANPLP